MATDAGISDSAIISETRHKGGDQGGWASLGAVLGGSGVAQGAAAYDNGMRVGAQTADALAQAKDRVQKSTSAEQAAAALESPQLQQQLHLTPELGSYFATQARMGKDPKEVTGMMLENQQYQLRARIADTKQPLDERHAAAFAEAPASMAPKAEGSLGSVFDPGANGGSGQTAVSPLQTRVAEAGVGLKDAQAAAAPVNAAAHTVSAANSGTGNGKLQTGYRWKMNPDNPGEVMLDPSGKPLQEPNPASSESAVTARYHEVVLNAANGISREAANVQKMGYDTSKGAMTIGGTHSGILNTLTDNLGKGLSSTDQQQYSSTMTNIGRFMSQIENAGRMPPGTMTAQLDKLAATPGTTENARLYNLALVRQNMEAGADTINASGASPAVKTAYAKALKSTQESIPFTPSQIIDFERTAKKGVTLQQFLSGNQASSTAPSGATSAPVDLGNGWTVVKH